MEKIINYDYNNKKNIYKEKYVKTHTDNIGKIFLLLKEILLNIDVYVKIHIQITTIDAVIDSIILDNENKNELEVTNKVIKFKDKVIVLTQISKLKLLTGDIESKDIVDLIINNIASISSVNLDDIKYIQKNNYNKYTMNTKTIENYINNSAKLIGYEGINTKLIKEKYDKEILFDNTTVVSDIHLKTKDIISDISTNSKNVVTENSKIVEVAKSLKSTPINVVTEIKMNNLELISNPIAVNAIKEIEEKKSLAITNIDISNVDSALVNINKDKQILKTKSIEIIELSPINKNLSKDDIDLRALRIDPTGEGYVGVILDDGTFEPLKVSKNKLKVLDEDVDNVLCNIDSSNQLKNVVQRIDNINKNEFLNDIKKVYQNNIVTYDKKNIINSKDLMKYSTKNINNVMNIDESVSVFTNDNLETIKEISQVKRDNIECINDIYNKEISSISLCNSENDDKEELIMKDYISNTQKNKEKENIDGEIVSTGNGIILVRNNNSDISIYLTSKLNSIN